MTPELSILILTYNEGGNIRDIILKLQEVLPGLTPHFEIVVVDGGSRDGTQDRAREAGALVFQQRDPGYGAAFREGLEHTRGDCVVTLDADMSHDPALIRGLWERRNDADIVIASRYMPGGSAVMPLYRRCLSTFLNRTYGLVLEIEIHDLSSGFRLYRRPVVEDSVSLVSQNFDVLEELLIKACSAGFRALEIPFHYAPRLHGESHLRVVKFGITYYKTLVRMARLRHSRDCADYDERAGRSLNPWRRLWKADRTARVRPLLGRGPLLDLGCGALALGLRGSPHIPGAPEFADGELVAADATPPRLRYFRDGGHLRVLVKPHQLPFAPSTFAAVYCTRPEFCTVEGLQEIGRVLRPDGRLLVDTRDRGRLGQAGFSVENFHGSLALAALKKSPDALSGTGGGWRCGSCGHGPLRSGGRSWECSVCSCQFPLMEGIPDLRLSSPQKG